MIENSLFKKLDAFPKISDRNYAKLRELGDLLMELQIWWIFTRAGLFGYRKRDQAISGETAPLSTREVDF